MTTSVEIGTQDSLQIAEHFKPAQGRSRRRFTWTLLLAYLLLAIGGVCMVTPFIWMILTSVKPAPELVDFAFFPENPTLQNYLNVLNTSSFERWYLNSIIVAIISTTSVVFFDTLVGYTLNKFEFPGKNIIFVGMLGTLMIPTEMLIIPWFTMSVNWSWHIGYAQYWGIAFPGVITAAGIFLMRQFFDGVPNELLDAARIDGMNEFGIWWRIAAPLVKPAIAALAIFNFIGNWNAYLWPLILANSREFYTLPVGLSFFRGESTTHWEKIMTAASLASIPLLIVFLVFQRQIIRGIALTGLKG
ncbi:MAG: carbohydrate ABC transporter permease [Caldilineaceae bacterium SB0670_bin_27]|uniref:Carbohydrate ABC transporter permease n=1 Tax=Caldilineaceae bacterium SB0664_bin_27 TaxID=2605260 RepID=A0A6B0YW31_9CHLR|nr:carbohydrate ABC transporter permease [Caldilineaceae bacterium SB0664_bin_27]MYJ79753.1 carbohydrate ABC transporter permease [Caldilineaceae bacterium SB0670_bin_27]